MSITVDSLNTNKKTKNKNKKEKKEEKKGKKKTEYDKFLQLREVVDSKRFYKKSISKNQKGSKYEVGTVIAGPTDYYDRLKRKEKPRTLVEELLKNQQVKKSITKRFKKLEKERPKFTKQKPKIKTKQNNKKKMY